MRIDKKFLSKYNNNNNIVIMNMNRNFSRGIFSGINTTFTERKRRRLFLGTKTILRLYYVHHFVYAVGTWLTTSRSRDTAAAAGQCIFCSVFFFYNCICNIFK